MTLFLFEYLHIFCVVAMLYIAYTNDTPLFVEKVIYITCENTLDGVEKTVKKFNPMGVAYKIGQPVLGLLCGYMWYHIARGLPFPWM